MYGGERVQRPIEALGVSIFVDPIDYANPIDCGLGLFSARLMARRSEE